MEAARAPSRQCAAPSRRARQSRRRSKLVRSRTKPTATKPSNAAPLQGLRQTASPAARMSRAPRPVPPAADPPWGLPPSGPPPSGPSTKARGRQPLALPTEVLHGAPSKSNQACRRAGCSPDSTRSSRSYMWSDEPLHALRARVLAAAAATLDAERRGSRAAGERVIPCAPDRNTPSLEARCCCARPSSGFHHPRQVDQQ